MGGLVVRCTDFDFNRFRINFFAIFYNKCKYFYFCFSNDSLKKRHHWKEFHSSFFYLFIFLTIKSLHARKPIYVKALYVCVVSTPVIKNECIVLTDRYVRILLDIVGLLVSVSSNCANAAIAYS